MSEKRYANVIGNDEFLVQDVPAVPYWNETFGTLFGDPLTGASGVFYLGRWWGDSQILRAMCGFMLPDGRAVMAISYGAIAENPLPAAAGLRTDPRPDGTIRYSYSGPAAMRRQTDVSTKGMLSGPMVRLDADFLWTPRSPIWEMRKNAEDEEATDAMFPGGHIEALGDMSGSFKIDGESFDVGGGFGVRDHSRGVRDFKKHQGHVWTNARFPSGWGFWIYLAQSRGVVGNAVALAAVYRGDKLYPATVECSAKYSPGSDIWAPWEITLHVKGEAPIKVSGKRQWNCYQLGMYEPADIFWGVPNGEDLGETLWALEQSVEYECNGEAGFGHVERCNKDVVVDDHWRSLFG